MILQYLHETNSHGAGGRQNKKRNLVKNGSTPGVKNNANIKMVFQMYLFILNQMLRVAGPYHLAHASNLQHCGVHYSQGVA